MKRTPIIALLAAMLLSACATNPAKKEYQRQMASQGLIPYSPPQGNPIGAYDWHQYGPGTIVRVKDGRYVTSADEIIGEQGVNLSKERITYFPLFSGQTYKKGSFDLTGSLAAANSAVKVAEATISGQGVRATGIEFINPRISKPYAISRMRRALTKAWNGLDKETIKELNSGKSVVVHDVVIADGLRFHFNKSKEIIASGTVTLTTAQKLALNAKGISTFDGGIEVKQPVFVAFRKLD